MKVDFEHVRFVPSSKLTAGLLVNSLEDEMDEPEIEEDHSNGEYPPQLESDSDILITEIIGHDCMKGDGSMTPEDYQTRAAMV